MDFKLISKIHALPSELYNQIRAEVFSNVVDFTTSHNITSTFKFPYHLHINRGSRQDFLTQTSATEFTFISWDLLIKFYRIAQEMNPRPNFTFNMVHPGGTDPGDWNSLQFDKIKEIAGRDINFTMSTSVADHAISKWAMGVLKDYGVELGEEDWLSTWEFALGSVGVDEWTKQFDAVDGGSQRGTL